MKNAKKCLIACSGGPDSMALLDMYKDKLNVYVCHINYHQRPTAKRDENIVKEYCKEWNIPFFKYDYKNIKKGNFQKLAREFRYECFKKVAIKNDIDYIYTAHQMDDNIETYLMQLKRNSSVNCYGIPKNNVINSIKVYRPLLNKTKEQLVKYDEDHNIKYGIDESNNSDKYERNKVRHSKVDKMSYKEKKELVKEIDEKNKQLKQEIKETSNYINGSNKYNCLEFINYKYFDRLIRLLVSRDLSSKYIQEINKALRSKDNIELKVKNRIVCKEYGYIYVYDIPKDYSYKINTNSLAVYERFKIAKKGDNKSGVFVCKDDYPLTIRNYKNGDSISLLYGTKKINRFFIDSKISSYDRKVWPIVLNKKGEVILVPGIGCNKGHYSKKYNLYVLKLS